MKLLLSSNAREYATAIATYASETGKTFGEALAREGPDFRTELYNQFRTIHPKPDSIPESAKARGYRVRRLSSTSLVRVEGGVSQRALSRASEILAGQKSDYFRWAGSRLVPVRFSARGKHRVLQGGRSGRRFASSALHAYQLTPEDFAQVSETDRFKSYGPRRLNLRALAVYLELLYRQRAAQGGTMAIQWLLKTWRKGSSTQRAQLIQRSATGIPIGTVDFEFDSGGTLQSIVFNGYVPGTGKQAENRGLLDKVFAARAPELLNAIKLHHEKLARQSRLA